MDAQIRPGEQFPLVWQNPDSTDSTTYYPQSIIRNSLTGSIIATVNLTPVTGASGQYSGSTLLNPDAQALGYWVNETLTVFSDSGHNTKVATFTVENRKYLVQERINRILGANFGGGSEPWLQKDWDKLEEYLLKHRYVPEKDTTAKSTQTMVKALQQAVFDALQVMGEQHAEQFNGLFDQISTLAKMMGTTSDAITGVDKKMLPGSVVDMLTDHGSRMSALGEMLSKIGKYLHSEMTARFDAHKKDMLSTMDSYHKQHLEKLKFSGDEIVKSIEGLVAPIDTIIIKKGKELRGMAPKDQGIDYLSAAKKLFN